VEETQRAGRGTRGELDFRTAGMRTGRSSKMAQGGTGMMDRLAVIPTVVVAGRGPRWWVHHLRFGFPFW
jgi:hypothetical protein